MIHRKTSWRGGTLEVAIRQTLCLYGCMTNKALLSSPQTLQDLQDFMFDTMMPAEMCVDWFCERFNVSADDDVIDFVVDAHFGMFADQ